MEILKQYEIKRGFKKIATAAIKEAGRHNNIGSFNWLGAGSVSFLVLVTTESGHDHFTDVFNDLSYSVKAKQKKQIEPQAIAKIKSHLKSLGIEVD